MKKTLLTMVAALAATCAFAQKNPSLEVEAGLNSSTFQTNAIASSYDAKWGFHVGLRGTFDVPSLAKGVYTNVGAFLSLKGITVSDPETSKKNDQKVDLYYLEVPVHVGYKFTATSNLSFFGEVGPYVAYGLFGNAVTKDASIKRGDDGRIYVDDVTVTTPAFDEVNRFDAGVGLRVGAQLYNKVNVSCGYDWGLTNMHKQVGGSSKNRNFTLSVGYIF